MAAAADVGEDSSLLQFLLEAPQGGFNILVFTYVDLSHMELINLDRQGLPVY